MRDKLSRTFSPTARTRAAEALRAARQVLSELPLAVGLSALLAAAAEVGPLRARLRQEGRAATSELTAVDQAIAWTIALYQALLPALGRTAALAAMERVVQPSGQRLMSRAFVRPGRDSPLEDLTRFVLPALQHAERHGLYRLGPQVRAGSRHLEFEITYCRYTELCTIAGVPELASGFCAVDGPFFAGLCAEVVFSCPARLTAGDPACTFSFSLREPGS